MEETLENSRVWRSTPWRIAAWTAGAGVMLLPISIQAISGNFGWSTGDFVFVGVILFTSCFIFDLAARKPRNLSYLLGSAAALAAGSGLVVVNGAVGLVGSEDEAHNLLFLAVILVAIVGAVFARGRPEGMAAAMFAAGVSHLAISAALLIRARGVSDGDARMEILGLSILGGIWLAAAWLFRHSSQDRP
jgi:peptidoglycan/LPS O-acetylase OafA/YrhL